MVGIGHLRGRGFFGSGAACQFTPSGFIHFGSEELLAAISGSLAVTKMPPKWLSGRKTTEAVSLLCVPQVKP